MKTHQILFPLSLALGLLVGVVACQQRQFSVSQGRFQEESNKTLAKLSGRISGTFRGISSGRGADDFGSGQVSFLPQDSMTSVDGSFGFPSWAGGFQQAPQTYMGDVQSSAQKCVTMIATIPQTRATYSVAMASLSRCLNRLVQERNQMLTWMYQQNSNDGQRDWAYALNYGRFGTANQMPQNDFSYLYLFAQNGIGSGF